jgi:hypothetical protein
MDPPHGDLPHPTKSQRAAYYLLVSIILGTGIYFLVEGISQFWH